MNWLGDQFNDNTKLTILEIHIPMNFTNKLAFDTNAPFEVKYNQTIPRVNCENTHKKQIRRLRRRQQPQRQKN